MAPAKDEVDSLRDLVKKLEARVGELESKLGGNAPPTRLKSPTESIRMILMGPPGAGMNTWHPRDWTVT